MNFEKLLDQQVFKNHNQICPSLPTFFIAVLLIPSSKLPSSYFVVSLRLMEVATVLALINFAAELL